MFGNSYYPALMFISHGYPIASDYSQNPLLDISVGILFVRFIVTVLLIVIFKLPTGEMELGNRLRMLLIRVRNVLRSTTTWPSLTHS